jgi:hypothetical protein
MYLSTDEFRVAMNKLDDLSVQIISPIRELKISKGEFYERRLTFDLTFHWTDTYVVESAKIIDSVETAETNEFGGL